MESLHIHSGKSHEVRIGRLLFSVIVAEDPRYPLWKRLFADDKPGKNGRMYRKTVFFSFSRLDSGEIRVWKIVFWFLMIHFLWV